jgi:hypothetical protein
MPTVSPDDIADGVSRTLFAESAAAMDAGFVHSSLLMAGVALEHSIRRFAQANGLDRAGTAPISRLLDEMKATIPAVMSNALVSLWRVRNALAHRRDEAILSGENAREILDSLGWAIRFLSSEQPAP